MFKFWTLYKVLLFFNLTCFANNHLFEIQSFSDIVTDPFTIYLFNRVKKINSFKVNTIYFDEIKDFVNNLKKTVKVTYLGHLKYKNHLSKMSHLSFLFSNSWALGPNGGLVTTYSITKKLQIIGKAAENITFTKIDSILTKDEFLMQPTTDIGLGFGYKIKIFKRKLNLRTFYDFNVISDLELIVQKAKLMNKQTISFDDFYFHGLSGILSIDF
jgi:hypothetical protein